jgi:2-polyprenyl-3-methyl-5-hydroxy-6-metoxy-1,4-benzoquinol methylase
MQNTAFVDKDSHYYVRLKWWMLPLIKDGPNIVMDMGCASGVMGRKLLDTGKAKEVYGVEIFESAAAEAATIYKKVHVGDIEEMDLDYKGVFDYIICGDILEHLRDPYKIVRLLSTWLKPGGSLFVCVPNVRNYHVVRDLVLHGKWEYVSAGIMDRTHLRFFTASSCKQMMLDAGFDVYHDQMIVSGPKKTLFNRVTFRLFNEFLAEQTFCCGRTPNSRNEPAAK